MIPSSEARKRLTQRVSQIINVYSMLNKNNLIVIKRERITVAASSSVFVVGTVNVNDLLVLGATRHMVKVWTRWKSTPSFSVTVLALNNATLTLRTAKRYKTSAKQVDWNWRRELVFKCLLFQHKTCPILSRSCRQTGYI